MNLSCKELKRRSRQFLLGNYGIVIVAYILVQVIVSAVMSPFQTSIQNSVRHAALTGQAFSFPWVSFIAIVLISLASVVLTCGLSNMHLQIARGEKPTVLAIFSLFKLRPDRFIVVGILLALIGIACMVPGYIILFVASILLPDLDTIAILILIAAILCIIAGVVLEVFFSLRFALSIYYLIDDVNTSAVESMKLSFHAMKGNCSRLLYMIFSFLPMTLLIILSFGIASLWIQPYIENVMAVFYLDASGELKRKEEEARRLEDEMGPILDDI